MGVASFSVANPARTKALMVRLAPYLVEAICELTRAIKDKTHAQSEISGLLFGNSQDGLVTVEALKTFKDSSGPRSDLARRERMEKAFTAAMALAHEDPEFAGYKLLGWFSLRGGGGLINSDIEFHNHHFKHPEEIALIVWREGDTQLTSELYAAVENGKLTTEDYRWSSVRLSTELRHVSQPVDLVMRIRMNDDLYMRTYGVSDGREKQEEWKKIAESAKRTLLSFLPGRGHSDVIPNDQKIPEPSGTAKRSFESRTLFRGVDSEPASVTVPLPKPQPDPVAPPAKSHAAVASAITRIQQQLQSMPPHEADTPVPTFDFNRAPRPKPASAEVSGLPAVIPKNKPSRGSGLPWISTALVFVLFSGLTFAFMAFRTGGSVGDNKISQVMRVLFPGSDLELHAASHGDSLWISWNRKNPTVSAATGAVLSVTDGPRHFERKLDPGQVADGEVKYTPVSGDVTFQLRVYGQDQSVATGNLRVLDATAPVTADTKPPLDVSAGATVPPGAPPNSTAETLPVSTGLNTNNKATLRNSEAANSKPTLPKMTPPPIQTSDIPQLESAPPTTSTKPVVTRTQTAQQQQPSAVTSTAAPRTPPTGNYSTPQTSNTAINGWDPNITENKVAPSPQQAAPRQTSQPPDSKVVDFVPPKVLLQVMPNTRNLTPGSITELTRVDVEVQVDRNGHVRSAHVTSPNVKPQLASAAMAAAKQFTFQAATLRGQSVDSDHTIRFEFRPEGQ